MLLFPSFQSHSWITFNNSLNLFAFLQATGKKIQSTFSRGNRELKAKLSGSMSAKKRLNRSTRDDGDGAGGDDLFPLDLAFHGDQDDFGSSAPKQVRNFPF